MHSHHPWPLFWQPPAPTGQIGVPPSLSPAGPGTKAPESIFGFKLTTVNCRTRRRAARGRTLGVYRGRSAGNSCVFAHDKTTAHLGKICVATARMIEGGWMGARASTLPSIHPFLS